MKSQIKVKNVQKHSNAQGKHIVIPAKLILLSSTKNEITELTSTDTWLNWCRVNRSYVLPVIATEHERIEIGDYVLGTDHKIYIVDQHFMDDDLISYIGKILALPEHFSEKQLQAIVDDKRKYGDEVLIKCKNTLEGEDVQYKKGEWKSKYQIYFNKQNQITLFPAEQSPKVLICNDCKQFWLDPTNECPDCGCKTLTRTHPSNAKYSKDTKQSLEENIKQFVKEFKQNNKYSFLHSVIVDETEVVELIVKWAKENNH